jgi:hypothetical protein
LCPAQVGVSHRNSRMIKHPVFDSDLGVGKLVYRSSSELP